MHQTDSQLLAELGNGSEAAFKSIFTSYYSPLCEYASKYVDDQDAEELVQELMTHLWEIREDILIVSSLRSYLFVSVKNRCINHLNRKKRQDSVHEKIVEKLNGGLDTPESYMLDELAVIIEKAVSELPDNYRKVFTMSRFMDYSNKEIAEELGVTVKTVEYHITQSLKILRGKLKDYSYLVVFLI